MRLLTWGVIGVAIFGALKRLGKFNFQNEQQLAPSIQKTTTPVQIVANSNPLTANTPKQ
ncbi:hypothetical protein ACIQXF_02070 [Lysinibacillus sp. NPDC097231]|uniref:hypothetical protein n=1 Tax=Lysinibacillus sp. NPDC097231 TaxID=3364142 RepID=UPI0037F2C497